MKCQICQTGFQSAGITSTTGTYKLSQLRSVRRIHFGKMSAGGMYQTLPNTSSSYRTIVYRYREENIFPETTLMEEAIFLGLRSEGIDLEEFGSVSHAIFRQKIRHPFPH